MPDGQLRMIETVARANPNTVVVLLCGCAVECPWADDVRDCSHAVGEARISEKIPSTASSLGKMVCMTTPPLCKFLVRLNIIL